MSQGPFLNKQSASALLLTTLSGCITFDELEHPDLSKYTLPAVNVLSDLTVDKSLTDKRTLREASDKERVLIEAFKSEGLAICQNGLPDFESLKLSFRHNLMRTHKVSGSTRAGSFAFELIDLSLEADASPELLRSGKLSGTFYSNTGHSFPAEGEYELVNNGHYEQLSFQLRNSLVGNIKAHFTRPGSDPGSAFLYFSINAGALASLLGIPDSDSELHFPVNVSSGGVLHLDFHLDDIPEILTELKDTIQPDMLSLRNLEDTLKANAPLSIYARECKTSVLEEKVEISKNGRALIVDLVTQDIDLYNRLPVAILVGCVTPGEELIQKAPVICFSKDLIVFTLRDLSEDELARFMEEFESLEIFDIDNSLFQMKISEFRHHLCSIDKPDAAGF